MVEAGLRLGEGHGRGRGRGLGGGEAHGDIFWHLGRGRMWQFQLQLLQQWLLKRALMQLQLCQAFPFHVSNLKDVS